MNVDEIERIVYKDEKDEFLKLMRKDLKSLKLFKKKNGDTLLHLACRYGAENIFESVMTFITQSRLNMYNKMKRTPFYEAVNGPSDFIFKEMMKNDLVDREKCDKKDTYGGMATHRCEPIFSLITKPQFSDRVEYFFNNHRSLKTAWQHWYYYSMWQGQEWAVDLVFKTGVYWNFNIYEQQSGMQNAIMFGRRKLIKKVYDIDNIIFEPRDTNSTPLSAGLKREGTFEFLLGLIPNMETTKSDKPYDELIYSIKNYEPKVALEYFTMVMKKDIFISDECIENMTHNQYNGNTFFESCLLRKDYNSRIIPLLQELGVYDQFLPDDVKDIFVF